MDYIDLAKKYHPKKIKVLFIGESPPNRALMIDGICKPSYFYAEYDNSYSLASILNCDIFGKEHQKGEWKKEFLENFFKERLYLIDLYPHEPIDKSKPDSEISAKLDKGKETIVQRVENENPEAIVILMESLYNLNSAKI